jgi:hypothetical protein
MAAESHAFLRALRECPDIVNAAGRDTEYCYESCLSWAYWPKRLPLGDVRSREKLSLCAQGVARWPSLPAVEEVS